MNNINENRTDERTPGGEKNKAELKWFILFLAVIFFLPITILAVVEWFTSADAFAIGITGFMRAVIVYGGLGLVAVIIALVSVSYTHLDVYKRQGQSGGSGGAGLHLSGKAGGTA